MKIDQRTFLDRAPRPELADALREADEDDVEAALADSYVADALQGIAPDVLLEFFRRMLDRLIGPEDD